MRNKIIFFLNHRITRVIMGLVLIFDALQNKNIFGIIFITLFVLFVVFEKELLK